MKTDERTGYSRIAGCSDRLNIWSDFDLVIWDTAEEASADHNLWCVTKIIKTRFMTHFVMINVSVISGLIVPWSHFLLLLLSTLKEKASSELIQTFNGIK